MYLSAHLHYFMCVGVSLHTCMCTTCIPGTGGSEERTPESGMVVSHHAEPSETKPRPSARAAGTLDCQAISLGPESPFKHTGKLKLKQG